MPEACIREACMHTRGVYASSIQHRNLLRERTRRFALAEPARRPVREKSSQVGEQGYRSRACPRRGTRRVCARRVCVLDSAPKFVARENASFRSRRSRTQTSAGEVFSSGHIGVGHARGVYTRGVHTRRVYASSIQHRNLLRERTRRFALAEPARRPVREKSSQVGEAGISESGMPETCIHEACIRDACMRPRFSTEICCERERVVSLAEPARRPVREKSSQVGEAGVSESGIPEACIREACDACMRPRFSTEICCERERVVSLSQSPRRPVWETSSQVGEVGISESGIPEACIREACIRDACMRPRFSTEICCERECVVSLSQSPYADRCGRSLLKWARQGYRSRACPRRVYARRAYATRVCVLDSAPKSVARENASFRSRRARVYTQTVREKSSQVGEAGISESGMPETCIREACMRDACMRPRFSTEICCERERVVSLSQSPHADRCGRRLLKWAR